MKVIFAGGGTAGHIYPAVAVADKLKKENGAECIFFGGTGNIEEKVIPQRGYPLVTRPLGGLSREKSLKGLRKSVRSVIEMESAVSFCKKLIDKEKPDVVMGTGGYVSYPMVLAACKKGIRTAILEVNAAAGFATRRLSSKVDSVMVCYEDAKKSLVCKNPPILTGCPVREEIIKVPETAYEPYFKNGLPQILCFWGSVGASEMNKKMVDLICEMKKSPDFNLLMSTGAAAFKWMPDALRQRGIDMENDPNLIIKDYIYDMDRAYGTSSLIISRAGGSLNEICVAGKPSLIVPSPYVTDNHQEKNAAALENAGAAVMLREKEITGTDLLSAARGLLADKQKLRKMAECAYNFAHPDALDEICKVILK